MSCSENNAQNHRVYDEDKAIHRYDSSLKAGKIIDTVQCAANKSQSYALYLPSFYSAERPFPCICFFDAHARGALPIHLYKSLAEKYGVVFVASNVSKNGLSWPETDEHIRLLLSDIQTRFHIDTNRMYMAGFSGGARVASSFAIQNKNITGVFACGAGFPNVNEFPSPTFDFVGMVGVNDFNLTEMEQLDEKLEQHQFRHQILTSEGKHDWANLSSFEMAMLWMQVNAMKEKNQLRNEDLILAFQKKYDEEIKQKKATKEWTIVYDLLQGVIKTLDGLMDISSYKKQLNELNQNPSCKKEKGLQKQLAAIEFNQQQELANQFNTQNEAWWIQKITSLKLSIKISKVIQEAQMNSRLLNYLGLVAYLNANHEVQNGNLMKAEKDIYLLTLIDPSNPDGYYLKAVLATKKGNNSEALLLLNKAVSLGYSDLSQLTSDIAFASVQKEKEFNKLVERVRHYADEKLCR